LAALCGVALLAFPWKSCTPAASNNRVRISAAVSLKPALEEARPLLSRAAGMPVEFNFASSGALAAQIIRGAPVDLFLSADRESVDSLAARNLVAPSGIVIIATNDLVVAVPSHVKGIESLADLGGPSMYRLAIGDPKTVPAGRYAKQALQGAGLWEQLSSGDRLVMGENVAQVLTYLSQDEVDAGVVYRSDIQFSSKVAFAFQLPASSHSPIEYASAVLAEAPQGAAATAIQKALLEVPIQKIFIAHGFGPPAARRALATHPATVP
jgi:molybdate transport system substrate-binding protein